MVSPENRLRKVEERRLRSGGYYPWLETDPNRDNNAYSPCWDKCKKCTPIRAVLCANGNCTEIYCAECGRYLAGFGPMGCPCDWYGNCSGRRGHHTQAEQAGYKKKMLGWTEDNEPILRSVRKRKPSKR